MAQLAVDAEGKRIKTDILVSGYIKKIATNCALLIPVEINKICFDFWFIQICDEWDDQYLSEGVIIDGEIVKHTNDCDVVSIYGCHSIVKGLY